jgi:hypothetical protein
MTDDLVAWILKYESGRAWFNKLNSDVTKRIYLKRLKDYCDAVGKNPDELIHLKLDGLKHVGEPSEYQAENLLETYLATANLTVDMKVSFKTAIMSFYAKNRRRLESDVAENIERGEPKKRCPKIEDILQLENAMTTQRDKALLWFVASAPIRLGTIPKLKWKDLIATNDKDVPYYMLIESARLKGSGKGKYKGVNVFTGKVENSIENGVIEPIIVKIQAIKSAAESASMILRIDDVITSKSPKGGPGGGMPGGPEGEE